VRRSTATLHTVTPANIQTPPRPSTHPPLTPTTIATKVELLLTLEEYCAEEGVFEGAGEAGPLFATVFAQLLQFLYEGDVVDEEAFSAWAGEKQHADESERVYLDKVGGGGGSRAVVLWGSSPASLQGTQKAAGSANVLRADLKR